MKLRGLVVAGVILAALSGALYWSNKHPEAAKAKDPADAESEAGPTIFSLKEPDIAKFDLKRKGASQVSLQRDASGKWQMTAPQPLPVDQAAVVSLLGTFSTFNSQRVVEPKAANLDQYGLSAAAFEIDMTEKSGKTHQFFLGDEAPTGNSLYARIGDSPEVYLVASFQRTSIDKTPNDLRDKRLLTASPEKISQVDLLRKKENIVFGRSKDEWQILKPVPARADDYAVDQLVRKLVQAQMDLSGDAADPGKTAATFSSGSPIALAMITEPSGIQQLELRKNKDTYYAKSSVVPGIYKIAADLPESLDKDIDTYRNKKLFDFGFDDPEKIEIQSGDKKYFLTKGGEDWFGADGKKLDPDTADTLLSAVRDLAATKFVSAGFTTPTIEIVVTPAKGKPLEKVSIAKSGEDFLAKREGDTTTLYWIDDEPIKALQKAADDLKPATAATPSK